MKATDALRRAGALMHFAEVLRTCPEAKRLQSVESNITNAHGAVMTIWHGSLHDGAKLLDSALEYNEGDGLVVSVVEMTCEKTVICCEDPVVRVDTGRGVRS